jgi:hypothetical protein
MSFWNVDWDDSISKQLYFDGSILAYMFRTATGWYIGNNSWYNEKYSVFHDFVELYNPDHLQEEDLLEGLRDKVPHHNKQEWLEELVIEDEQHTMVERINPESFIPYYCYINAIPKVSSKRRRETKKFKRLPNHHLSSYNSDDPRTYVYPDHDNEEKRSSKRKRRRRLPIRDN